MKFLPFLPTLLLQTENLYPISADYKLAVAGVIAGSFVFGIVLCVAVRMLGAMFQAINPSKEFRL